MRHLLHGLAFSLSPCCPRDQCSCQKRRKASAPFFALGPFFTLYTPSLLARNSTNKRDAGGGSNIMLTLFGFVGAVQCIAVWQLRVPSMPCWRRCVAVGNRIDGPVLILLGCSLLQVTPRSVQYDQTLHCVHIYIVYCLVVQAQLPSKVHDLLPMAEADSYSTRSATCM